MGRVQGWVNLAGSFWALLHHLFRFEGLAHMYLSMSVFFFTALLQVWLLDYVP
jgi:hypothetical protein